jgi:Fe-Mn family superoxide dismutase
MSAQTLLTHHGKHHAGYIKKTNASLKERADAPKSLEEVVRLAACEKNRGLFNNAAQAWNHAFFWQCLTAEPQGEPQGGLRRAIEKHFGGVASFVEEARSRGEGHFASGWLWLVADDQGALALEDLHDAASPVVDAKATPLFTCDLWEHAYYLDYKNDRAQFLASFFDKLINWRFAEGQYEAARSGASPWRFPG